MNGYAAGFDGGGTKTEIACLRLNGNALPGAVRGPMNLNGASEERIRATISECFMYLRTLPGGLDACKSVVIGTAGVSNIGAKTLIMDAVRKCGYQGPLLLTGDQDIALAGAVGDVGAVLIAGTGAICCGRNEQGESIRVGGYGYLIDDEGSGYALGRDILAAVARAHDGRAPATCLTEAVYERLGIRDPGGIVTYIYAPERSKSDMAAFAPLLLPALERGDEAALAIAQKAAQELALLASTAWRRLGLTQGDIALSGSIFAHYAPIRAGVVERLHGSCPRLRCIEPRGGAASGAAALALKAALRANDVE